jgi:hypothetical protein
MGNRLAAGASKLNNPTKAIVAVLLYVAAVGGFSSARADGLQAGLWRIVTKPEVNGAVGADQETMRCLTDNDVANLEATFSPNSRTINSDCEQPEVESTPQHLKWRLRCKGQIDMDIAGEFSFDDPKHYTATVTTRASMMGQQIQNSRAMIEARHVGACHQ